MAVLPILAWPDPRLAQTCPPVEPGDALAGLIADMFETMYAAPGRGLAGPQVGVMKRVFVTDTTWKDGPGTPIAYLNPRIIECAAETVIHDEGCLSIVGISVPVERPAWVVMEWTTPEGETTRQRFEGFAAACVQHELDHLDGTVTLDHLSGPARDRAEIAYSGTK
ncbi:peptide deformylase [Arenibacterium sp. CAU 1754]